MLCCHISFFDFIFQLRNSLFESDGTTLIRRLPKQRKLGDAWNWYGSTADDGWYGSSADDAWYDGTADDSHDSLPDAVWALWSDGRGTAGGEIVKLGRLCHF